ncbi:MAG: hypothetical protein ABIH37_05550 [archaeon]
MNIIKLVGYILAGLGLAGLALSTPAGAKYAPFLEGFTKSTVTIGSICLVVVGALIVSFLTKKGWKSSGPVRHIQEEVPIYRGEGKDRRIVGYRAEGRK